MRQISSLELLFLMKKIEKKLVNSKIQKVKQINENTFSFEVYKQKERRFLLIILDKGLFLSDVNYESKIMTNFCQILRKHLTNQIIQSIQQHEFDRIVEIETRDYRLILELFGNGNIILVNKSDGKIISAFEIRSWKDRAIRPRREYKYPPSRVNPFVLSLADFKKFFGEKEVVKVLASDLGFGGEISEKICRKAGIDKNSRDLKDAENLYDFLQNISEWFKELEAVNKELKKEFEQDLIEKQEKILVEAEKKFEKIKKSQLRKLDQFIEKEKTYRNYAERTYKKYSEFDKTLKQIQELRDKDVSWEQISKKLKIEVIPAEAKVIVENIPIDLRKSLQKNADAYFQKAKRMKKKIEGLKKAMKELEKEKIVEVEKKKKIVEKKPKEWYDKFRWFKSLDGFLVVAGKDARTNEQLIRKYMKENDLVFHTDITGSPFVLIKNPEGKEIPEQTIREAAEFCASYSKAWKIGLSTADVYYVKPDQVKKEGGLPAGSFMIYGKREWIKRIPLKVAIAVIDDRVIYGPESVVSSRIKDYILIKPGEEDIYPFLKNKFGSLAEKVKRVIPYGICSIIH